MSDRTAKMMEKVRALLAKAASTTFPEEADAFRAKADALMTEYAIDQWQIDQLEAGRTARPAPVRRDFDFSWWGSNNPFADQLWDLFLETARHCRCQAVARKWGRNEANVRIMPVFGIPSDLDWFDVLFTSLMLQMLQKVDPEPKASMTLNENLALFRDAGVPWDQAIAKIIPLGKVADKSWEPSETTFDKVYKPWVHGYRRWCRETGHPQSYVNQRTFRKHFADGFTDEVNNRLRVMRRASEQAYDEGHSAGSMALAVRDMKEVILEAVYVEFPDLRPHPADCECDACHTTKCRDPKCSRPRCVARRKPVRYRSVAQPKIDYAAREAGRAAGAKANISNNPGERIGNRRSLDK